MNDLSVNIINPVTATYPTLFRRYTLIPDSQNRGKGTLFIAPEYYLNDTEPVLRDELCGQWVFVDDNSYVLTLFVNVGSDEFEVAKGRYNNFLELLPDYVDSLINADKEFFDANPHLIPSHVSMRFISSHGQFNKTVYFCKVKDYLLA
ncbi:hypothetical protein H8923_06975 [Romboutsia hominis]|uniref:Staygreen protein domain-containing protein n=1 Tax=Romboutsia faecis TaxID=2764597 RepID=A0ABR7JPH2_9FIRM|nr:staygreen family protein [Romboutsia faecis]MBC5996501.1 hypothetical protein [Romboutsia faecis]